MTGSERATFTAFLSPRLAKTRLARVGAIFEGASELPLGPMNLPE